MGLIEDQDLQRDSELRNKPILDGKVGMLDLQSQQSGSEPNLIKLAPRNVQACQACWRGISWATSSLSAADLTNCALAKL